MRIRKAEIAGKLASRPPEYAADLKATFIGEEGDLIRVDPIKYRAFYAKWAPKKGLGDMVAKVAQPIAKAIDAVAGTNIHECSRCKQRQEALNKLGSKIGLTSKTTPSQVSPPKP